MLTMITIPQAFAADTITREGAAGQKWLAELPARVDALCTQWRLRIDGPVMHGYAGLAIPVRRGDELCVLRVGWLDEHTKTAPLALRAWNGNGAETSIREIWEGERAQKLRRAIERSD
ncbi:MAG: hypothetical protein KDE46_31660, partial [Caldilineaceae bacterium]|nr:hypothetical protein [Caldilineaceae bacterium]